jgi:hypothetical protein
MPGRPAAPPPAPPAPQPQPTIPNMPAPAPSPDQLGQLGPPGRDPAYDDPPVWPNYNANRDLIAQVLLRAKQEQERNRA